jgi:hypothetical protein
MMRLIVEKSSTMRIFIFLSKSTSVQTRECAGLHPKNPSQITNQAVKEALINQLEASRLIGCTLENATWTSGPKPLPVEQSEHCPDVDDKINHFASSSASSAT